MNMLVKIILRLLILFNVNLLMGFDELFEFKLKLLEKHKPEKQWCQLYRDVSFSLNSKQPESLLKMPNYLRIQENKIYILDNNLHKVVVYNKNKEFLGILGKSGKGPGDFYYPSWFEFYNGDLYIYNDFRIDVFSKQLKFLRRIRPFLPIYSFIIHDDHIFCTTNGKYRDKYPLFLKLDMNGRIEEEFYIKDLEKLIYQRSKQGNIIYVDHYILIFLSHWNKIYVYDAGSGHIKTIRIKYDLLDRIETWNDRPINKKKRGNFFWFSNIFASAKVRKGVIYILLKVPRLEIISIDLEGNIIKHYFNDHDFRYMRWKDFAIEYEEGKLVFYVLGYSIGKEEDETLNEFGVHRMLLKEK